MTGAEGLPNLAYELHRACHRAWESLDASQEADNVVKDERDPRTVVSKDDIQIERSIVRSLESLSCDILSEESEPSRSGQPRLAILDPIDGSLNYLKGTLGLHATSLALMEQGHRLAANIHMPQMKESLLMERDKGVFWTHDGICERVTHPLSRVESDIGAARICVARGTAHPRVLTQAPLASIVSACNETVNFASCSVGLACVALGRIDALVIPGQHLWDFAAGYSIIYEMGGHFATWETTWGKRVPPALACKYATPRALYDVVAAMNKDLFDQIVEHVQ